VEKPRVTLFGEEGERTPASRGECELSENGGGGPGGPFPKDQKSLSTTKKEEGGGGGGFNLRGGEKVSSETIILKKGVVLCFVQKGGKGNSPPLEKLQKEKKNRSVAPGKRKRKERSSFPILGRIGGRKGERILAKKKAKRDHERQGSGCPSKRGKESTPCRPGRGKRGKGWGGVLFWGSFAARRKEGSHPSNARRKKEKKESRIKKFSNFSHVISQIGTE